MYLMVVVLVVLIVLGDVDATNNIPHAKAGKNGGNVVVPAHQHVTSPFRWRVLSNVYLDVFVLLENSYHKQENV
jgi:hypothetical protein